MNVFLPENPIRSFTVLSALCISTASLAFSAIEGSCGQGLIDYLKIRPTQSETLSAEHEHEAKEPLKGFVEPIPDRVFRIMPYNDWPLLRIDVHEGQRLSWKRVNGSWVGDNDVLTTQNETPAEIDGFIIKSEAVKDELAAVRSKADMMILQAETDLELARIRERNARQELDRWTGLLKRDLVATENHHRAENLWHLATAELAKAEKVAALQRQIADSEIKVAESRVVQAKTEFELEDFKRDLSWGKVPVHLIKGPPGKPKQVVVTRVAAVIGDQPPRSGEPQVWVELVDDSHMFVRTRIKPELEDELKPGDRVRVAQRGRTYEGTIVALTAVVDRESQEIPVIIDVDNHDRKLRIGSAVEVSFESVAR